MSWGRILTFALILITFFTASMAGAQCIADCVAAAAATAHDCCDHPDEGSCQGPTATVTAALHEHQALDGAILIPASTAALTFDYVTPEPPRRSSSLPVSFTPLRVLRV